MIYRLWHLKRRALIHLKKEVNYNVEVELLGTVREEVTFDIALGGGTASKLVDYNEPN